MCPPSSDDGELDTDTGKRGNSGATCTREEMKDEKANKDVPSASDTGGIGSSHSSGSISGASNGDAKKGDAQMTSVPAVPERYLIGCNHDEAEAARR